MNAVATLFVQHDISGFKTFVSADAIQGDVGPGSALAKIDKQRLEKLRAITLSQVIFFNASDVDRLEKQFPDELWPRVRKHIGEHQAGTA